MSTVSAVSNDTPKHIHPWGDTRPYYSAAAYFKQRFGERVQKLSLNAGFTCPNRDGQLSTGGCTFCLNEAFNPSYCEPHKSISQQIDEGIQFHQWRYRKGSHYIAYFQAYSNTYADINILKRRYEEALGHEGVIGLIIGTRPDCIDEEKLDYIASLSKSHYVAIEYGIESCYDNTLALINRGHNFECSARAVKLAAERGIDCGAHLILGLPNETREMMLNEATMLNQLPLHSLKLHQLQIFKGTTMEQQLQKGLIPMPKTFELEEYIKLVCDFVERLNPTIVVERFASEAPPRYQSQPDRCWRRADGKLLRNEEIPVLIEQELLRRDSWQGKLVDHDSQNVDHTHLLQPHTPTIQ